MRRLHQFGQRRREKPKGFLLSFRSAQCDFSGPTLRHAACPRTSSPSKTWRGICAGPGGPRFARFSRRWIRRGGSARRGIRCSFWRECPPDRAARAAADPAFLAQLAAVRAEIGLEDDAQPAHPADAGRCASAGTASPTSRPSSA